MFSSKIKYLISGILAYFSVVAIFASSPSLGSDGKFGDYFVRMTGLCPAGDVIIGYDTSDSDYGTKNCTPLKTLFRNIFGSTTPPADSSLVGFGAPIGILQYKENVWKTNANGISYTGSRVGIGTNTPGTMLDVVDGDINISPVWGGNIIIGASSAGTVKISDMNSSYFNGGYVGIGTSTPGTPLEVIGNTKISSQLVVKNIMLSGQPLKIPVVCTGQGKGLHWDGSNWSCTSMPIEGTCNNATANTCTYGTPINSNSVTCGGNTTWTCSGLNGGGSDTSCNKANPPCPVNGVCNNSTQYSCSVGASISNNAGTCGGNSTWTCDGTNGGLPANCSKPNVLCPVNGVCGGSANTCSAGSPSGYNAGSCNGSQTWVCNGTNLGGNANCSIANAACATVNCIGYSGRNQATPGMYTCYSGTRRDLEGLPCNKIWVNSLPPNRAMGNGTVVAYRANANNYGGSCQ